MRVLFIIDPLPCREVELVTSFAILQEFVRQNGETWYTDSPDIWLENRDVRCHAQKISVLSAKSYRVGPPAQFRLEDFDLVMLRKDPPFDLNYLYLTYILELAAGKVTIVNHPRGVRNANEKLAGIIFSKWMPETIVTSSSDKILEFQKKIKSDLVLKILNQKGGEGITLLRQKNGRRKTMTKNATKSGSQIILAQRFLQGPGIVGDKRILILNGEILSAYEKRFARGDFRANLSQGGTFHVTKITAWEKALVRDLKPVLLKEKLYFVGIDVMMERLIEINVTSPAGLPEAELLYPGSRLTQRVVDFFQGLRHS
ncbi:MAG: hypothetical protein HYZ84_05215 [Candidatus Omnitrophica bacterium]|nr:hypothetical protein [Candidatus Omnitrophota bacterium]